MTILHHPTDETLARYAARTLGAGPAVVVATHMAGCSICRARVANFEAIGGTLVEELPPVPVAPEAIARTLAMIDAAVIDVSDPAATDRPRQPVQPPMPSGLDLPAPLCGYDISRWRWLVPGIRWSRIEIPDDPKANVMLLWSGPNKKIPEHGHTGIEITQILSGSFTDGPDRYGPGDLSEVDADVEHQPFIDAGSECVCLAALEGHIRPHSVIGRLLRPFIGI